jgi:Flp pilus assembly protein TadG
MKRLVEIVRGAVFGVVRDRRGGVATFLAATIIPLIAFAGLAVDTSRGYLMKARLSSALDSAALAGGRAMHDPALRDEMVNRFFAANFPASYMGATITGPTITIDNVNNTITLDASANMASTLMRVLGVDTMDVAGTTEVKLSSRNVEVSLVVDVTGSMNDDGKLDDLKAAAHELIDIIVKDDQTPHYSKIALVPYSMGVNGGTYITQLRGSVTGTVKAITNATTDDPVVITAPAHGFTNGTLVGITQVNGMTQLNEKPYRVANATTNTFRLRNEADTDYIDGDDYNSYSSDGLVGTACTTPGCAFYVFDNASGGRRALLNTECVSERPGPTNAFNDVAPSVELVGRNYAPENNPCPSVPFIPLTSNKTTLHDAITALTGAGSTAGQIGLAWGWYLVSPNFGYLWPAEGQPAAYGAEELVKVVIFMTDGELNTGYNNGVIAQDSGTGSGSTANKINQNATNGTSFAQAGALCSAIKASGILVYTVGFDLVDLSPGETLMTNCATDSTYAYLPDSGTELSEAFHAIAINVARLHLSK